MNSISEELAARRKALIDADDLSRYDTSNLKNLGELSTAEYKELTTDDLCKYPTADLYELDDKIHDYLHKRYSEYFDGTLTSDEKELYDVFQHLNYILFSVFDDRKHPVDKVPEILKGFVEIEGRTYDQETFDFCKGARPWYVSSALLKAMEDESELAQQRHKDDYLGRFLMPKALHKRFPNFVPLAVRIDGDIFNFDCYTHKLNTVPNEVKLCAKALQQWGSYIRQSSNQNVKNNGALVFAADCTAVSEAPFALQAGVTWADYKLTYDLWCDEYENWIPKGTLKDHMANCFDIDEFICSEPSISSFCTRSVAKSGFTSYKDATESKQAGNFHYSSPFWADCNIKTFDLMDDMIPLINEAYKLFPNDKIMCVRLFIGGKAIDKAPTMCKVGVNVGYSSYSDEEGLCVTWIVN